MYTTFFVKTVDHKLLVSSHVAPSNPGCIPDCYSRLLSLKSTTLQHRTLIVSTTPHSVHGMEWNNTMEIISPKLLPDLWYI